MPETAENVAEEFNVLRDDQDAFAFRSQSRIATTQEANIFVGEIIPVTIPLRKGDEVIVNKDEQPRVNTTLAGLF